ncbi:MAG TPA: hypothetical protein H9686_01415 [Firmicutes bacterium]|nr:hypothetical protein [Bacillota bacterium]
MAGLQFTTNTIVGLAMLVVTIVFMVVFLCLKKNIDDGEDVAEQENPQVQADSDAQAVAQSADTSASIGAEVTDGAAEAEEEVSAQTAVEDAAEQAVEEEQPAAEEEEQPAAVEAEEAQAEETVAPAEESAAAVTEERPALNIPIGKRRTFAEKILEADDDNKAIYNMLKNELMSYKKVNNRLTKTIDIFKFKSTYLAKISIAGKTVKLHLALDPKDYAETKYHQKDLGEKKKYEFVPLALKVKSDRSKKYAVELIAEVMNKAELVKNDKYQPVDYVAVMQAAQEE